MISVGLCVCVSSAGAPICASEQVIAQIALDYGVDRI